MKKTVIIIGAGPMGLALAYFLSGEGFNIRLFESDDRAGGMAASFDFDGIELDRFYHFFTTSDTALFSLLEKLDMQEKLIWVETKMGFWCNGKIQKWGNPLALFRFKGLNIISKLRYAMHVFTCVRRRKWKSLDNIEAQKWIRRWIGNRAYDVLWKPLIEQKFHQFGHKISAAWVWARIKRVGLSRVNIMREKLAYIDGGTGKLIDRLMDELTRRGVEVNLSSMVEEIVTSHDGSVSGIREGSRFHQADVVVSTIPLPLVNKLLPNLNEQAKTQILSIENIGVVCVLIKLNKKLSENFWLNINDTNIKLPGLIEYSNLRKLKSSVIYAPFYMPNNSEKYFQSDDEFVAEVTTYLQMINPEISKSDVISAKVHRYKYAQPICGPNFLQTLPTKESIGIASLWVADTSYYYPEDRGTSESIDYARRLSYEITKCIHE